MEKKASDFVFNKRKYKKNKGMRIFMFVTLPLLVIIVAVGSIFIYSPVINIFTNPPTETTPIVPIEEIPDGTNPSDPSIIPPSYSSLWTYDQDTGEIVYIGSDNPTTLTVPETLDEKPVKSLKMNSIPNSVQTLVLPSTIDSMSSMNFSELENLEEIVIDNDTYGSFNGCVYEKDGSGGLSTLLVVPAGKMGTELQMYSGTTTIGERAFQNTNLVTLTLPGTITRIMPYAFSGSSFQQIILPSSLVTLDPNALAGVQSLVQIVLNSNLSAPYKLPIIGLSGGPYGWFKEGAVPNKLIQISTPGTYYAGYTQAPSVTSDGWGVFYQSGTNRYYISKVPNGSGVLIIPSTINSGSNIVDVYGLGGPNSTGGVINISNYSNVIIENGVKVIMYYAFKDCTNLTSISIPNSVTDVGIEAFKGCTQLTTITFGENSELKTIGNTAFAGCSSLTSITIPDSVTSIGGVKSLSYEPITLGVYKIEEYVFLDCFSLTAINVSPNGNLSSIDGVLFNKNQTILIAYPNAKGSSYEIPSGVTKIRRSAFYNCTNLTSITIPDSVTTIELYAFYGCSGLETITIGSGGFSDPHDGFHFEDYSNLKSINVSSSNPSYKSDNGVALLSKDGTIIYKYAVNSSGTSYTIPNGVTNIGNYAFKNSVNLTSITIPNMLTTIGDSAFMGCTDLTSVTIPNGVTVIPYNAFSGCTGLETITIGSGLLSLNAFDLNSPNLTSITIGANNANYSSINGVLFDKNQTLLLKYPANKAGTSYVIPSTVTKISGSAFKNCTNLTSVTIPESVTNIEGYSFQGCSNLATVTFSGTSQLNTVGNNAFDNTLWYNSLPDGVVYLGRMVYNYKGEMAPGTTIVLNEGIHFIGSSAFQNCTNLSSITIPNSVTNIWNYAFDGCTGLTSITIGSGITKLDTNIFDECTNLENVYIDDDNTVYYDLDGVVYKYAEGSMVEDASIMFYIPPQHYA